MSNYNITFQSINLRMNSTASSISPLKKKIRVFDVDDDVDKENIGVESMIDEVAVEKSVAPDISLSNPSASETAVPLMHVAITEAAFEVHEKEKDIEDEDNEDDADEDFEDDVDEDASLDFLGKAALGLEDTFVVDGTHPTKSVEVDIVDTNGKISTITFPTRFYSYNEETKTTVPTEALATLVASSQVSPFGDKSETRFDDTVRKAQHIPASRVMGIRGFDVNNILPEVRNALLPGEKAIRAELLKMNIYSEGGHFVAHRDTPLSTASVGSLVVALPSAHSGGELSIKHRNENRVIDFATIFSPEKGYYYKSDDNAVLTGKYNITGMSNSGYHNDAAKKERTKKEIQCGIPKPIIAYAAFYGDAVHEIKTITAGVRVTLTYQLLRDEPQSLSAAKDVVSSGSSSASAELTKFLLPSYLRHRQHLLPKSKSLSFLLLQHPIMKG